MNRPTLAFTERLTGCPLCGASCITQHFSDKLYRCLDCDLYFCNPRPDEHQITRSYNCGATYYAWQAERLEREPLWAKRLELLLRFKHEGRLLDVGTGDGHFLEYASQYFAVDATEISRPGVDYCTMRGFNPRLGSLDSLALEPSSYDLITLWHVLEHLSDPGASLTKLVSLLKPGGYLIVAVPNEILPLRLARFRRHPSRPVFPQYWGGEIHLSYFTPKTLKNALANAGLQCIELGVDDVHVHRSPMVSLRYHLNRVLNSVFSWHCDKAMYLVGQRHG